jgi:hypothetical protein
VDAYTPEGVARGQILSQVNARKWDPAKNRIDVEALSAFKIMRRLGQLSSRQNEIFGRANLRKEDLSGLG